MRNHLINITGIKTFYLICIFYLTSKVMTLGLDNVSRSFFFFLNVISRVKTKNLLIII